jgi:Domain of unknown function (DUF397)
MASLPEVAWLRSRDCDTNSCVEVAFLDDGVAVRDSKDESGPVLTFNRAEWVAFLAGARNGEFNVGHQPS